MSRELLAVPMQSAAGAGIQSGVARRAGVLWCTRHRARDKSDTAGGGLPPSPAFSPHS